MSCAGDKRYSVLSSVIPGAAMVRLSTEFLRVTKVPDALNVPMTMPVTPALTVTSAEQLAQAL